MTPASFWKVQILYFELGSSHTKKAERSEKRCWVQRFFSRRLHAATYAPLLIKNNWKETLAHKKHYVDANGLKRAKSHNHHNHSQCVKLSSGLFLPHPKQMTVQITVFLFLLSNPAWPAQHKVFLFSVHPTPPRLHLTPQHSQMLPTSDEQLQPKVTPCHGQTEACKQFQTGTEQICTVFELEDTMYISFRFKEQQKQIFNFYHLACWLF